MDEMETIRLQVWQKLLDDRAGHRLLDPGFSWTEDPFDSNPVYPALVNLSLKLPHDQGLL